MKERMQVAGFLIAAGCIVHAAATPGLAWGKGHRLIRLWAVEQLPQWQRELIGQPHWERLCQDYTSLQDRHAGGRAPELDPYCIVPGVRLSLHDVNPPEPTAKATLWYLDQIARHVEGRRYDEAMKFLGVLCHWNEDPGCPSAHSSPINEWQLKQLLPPPADKQRLNYLYGYGGIADVGDYRIPEEEYRPRLLGRTPPEAALRIAQHQRLLQRDAAAEIIPIVRDMLHGDGTQADRHRAAAALRNARHTADVIFTAVCLAANRFDAADLHRWDQQRLTDWLPNFQGGRIGHPYYVTPFLVNQAMDAQRNLHPLTFAGDEPGDGVTRGFGMGSPFALEFELAPGGVFERFTCRVGLHATAGPQGAVAFAVAVNGEELIRTEALTPADRPVTLDVDLPRADVLKLSLRTIPAEPERSLENLTVWAEPTLHRRQE